MRPMRLSHLTKAWIYLASTETTEKVQIVTAQFILICKPSVPRTIFVARDADEEALKNIACNSGIYAKIPDNGDLVEQMSAYYKLYAILQGGAENSQLGWSLIYIRHGHHPLWIGVVGVDFTISQMKITKGEKERVHETFERPQAARQSLGVVFTICLRRTQIRSSHQRP